MDTKLKKTKLMAEDDFLMMIVIGMGGNSAKTSHHYNQLIDTGKFRQFDYGPEVNLKVYGSTQPKEYNVSRVTAPVAFHYGATDKLVPIEGVLYMASILKRLVEARKVPANKFNHLDFICHMNVKNLLYDPILKRVEYY